jgi:hypothetical protein
MEREISLTPIGISNNNHTHQAIRTESAAANGSESYIQVFANAANFELAQRIATALSKSTLIPKDYQNNLPNVLVALEMAGRIGAGPLMVMQNLNIIQGRPSWSSTFIIAAINSCGRFTPVHFETEDLGKKNVTYTYTFWDANKTKQKKDVKVEIEDMSCIALATDKATGKVLKSIKITIEMAVKEGWYSKDGSKWQTMPELMLRYRSAAFFGRLYAPDVLMGMQTKEEIEDARFTEIPIEEKPTINIEAEAEKTPTVIEQLKQVVEEKRLEELGDNTIINLNESSKLQTKSEKLKKKLIETQVDEETTKDTNAQSLFHLESETANSGEITLAEQLIWELEMSENVEDYTERKQQIAERYKQLSKEDKKKVVDSAEAILSNLTA